MHNPIRHIALMGTGRSPITRESIPAEILQRLGPSSDELLLLESMSYIGCMQFFQVPLLHCPEELDDRTIDETLLYAPKEISGLLNDILLLKPPLLSSLLNMWLDMMVSRNELVMPEEVIKLIQTGNSLTTEVRQKITRIIGNRGNKILSYLPEQKYTISTNALWQESNAEQRRQVFYFLRETNPTGAISLLSESWNSENIKDKSAFLKIIAETLIPEDLAFLQPLYTSHYAGKAFQKNQERECKQWIVHMLLRLGYQPLIDTVSPGLQPYLKSNQGKSLLGKVFGNKMNGVHLPKSPDDFWNGKQMNELAGLDEKNTDPKMYDTDPVFWLHELIEIIPFHFWTKWLGGSYQQCVSYFLEDDQFLTTVQGKKESVFHDALFGIAILTHDHELIEQLIQQAPGEDLQHLVPFMKQNQFEKFIVESTSRDVFDLLNKRKENEANRWSVSFTRKVMDQLIQALIHGKTQPQAYYAMIMARFGHETLPEMVESIIPKYLQQPWIAQWQSQIVEPIQKIYTLKSSIRQNLKPTKQ